MRTWRPGHREITDKNLRKRVREAQRAADGAREAAARMGERDASA
jgi:tRNA (adenine57-N1/adenine58-N1)-methyltransferase